MKSLILTLLFTGILTFLETPVLPAWADHRSSSLAIHFLNVGEGDTTLIEVGDGSFTLIDTGNPQSLTALAPYFARSKVGRLDNLVVTHPHLDHAGGVFALLSLFPVVNVFDNGESLELAKQSNDMFRWYEEMFRSRERYRVVERGAKLVDEDVTVEVLWPPASRTSNDWNTNSIIIRVTYGDFHALLMGDGNIQTESELLKCCRAQLRADVLKAGHHGASDTGSLEFIDSVRPKLVVVSVNRSNVRGYPDNGVLERYESVGARVWKTFEHGSGVTRAQKNGNFTMSGGKVE